MPDNAAVVREFIEQVLNKGAIDQAGRYFWEDMVEEVPLPGQGPGLKGLQDVLRGMKAAFPDIHWKIEEQLSDGDRVMTRFVWTGTHRGPFLGIPPTGRKVSVWGVVIDRLVDGRIKQTRIIMDALGMMMQMGVIPPPGK
jgi:steroid delta-isomerase-like uncharacterized protein